jgi:hypothetical protein
MVGARLAGCHGDGKPMKATRFVLLFTAVAILIARPTDSCSFSEGPAFVFAKRPDAPVSAYAAGRLGILMPTFAHSHLVVAWRYLAGKPLSEIEQKAVRAYYRERLREPRFTEQDPNRNGVSEWVAVRNSVDISSSRPSSRPSNYRTEEMFFSVVNCTDGAFFTAAATLRSRIAKFGIKHPGVVAWVEAQNAVFSNCDRRSTPPAPAPASLPATFRHDRDYQIAAAAFYAADFDRAHDLFLAISREEASPWRRIARLVAARALIRKSVIGNFEGFVREPMQAADQELRAILADEDMRPLRRAASELEDYVQLHLAPEEQRAKLVQAIVSGHITQHDLTDFVTILDKFPNASDEMTDWINTFSVWGRGEHAPLQDSKAFAHAVDRWQSAHTLPWLVASIANATRADAHVDDLLDAAARVEPSSPAFVMIAYHRARLLLDRGEADSAKREIDRVLALPDDDLGASARNLFRELRMPLAASIDEFVNDAARLPAGTDLESLADPPYETLFDDDAAVVFNQALPLAALIEAARAPKLPDSIRAQLIAAAFTRAIVLGRSEVALTLVPEMHAHFDSAIKETLDRFAAVPPSRRRIEALDLLLNAPGLSPFVSSFEGRVNLPIPLTKLIHSSDHENWWCVGGVSYSEVKYPQYVARRAALHVPKFPQSRAIRDAFAAEQKELRISGASFMLRGAITWAKEYPDDPRVPEALAMAINGTRWSCPDEATSRLASSAFDLLHSRYSATKWARQTKHWYSGRD